MIPEKKPVATYSVMIICLIMFILVNTIPNFIHLESKVEAGVLLGAYYKAFILAGEWWRFLTCGFLHIDFLHFLMNMLSLFNLGRFMEILFDKKKLLTILIGSIIGGSMFMFILSGNTVAVGISGGLYGLMAAYTYFLIHKGMWKVPQVRQSLIQIYLINLWINFIPGVAYAGHLGGFVVGLLLSFILFNDDKKLQMHALICVGFLFGLLCVFVGNSMELKDDDNVYVLTDVNVLKAERDIGLKDYSLKMAEKLDKIYGIGNYIEVELRGD